METTFFFLINKNTLQQIKNITEILSEWGGEVLSREPKEYLWEGVRFNEGDVPSYIKRELSSKGDWGNYITLYPKYDRNEYISNHDEIEKIKTIILGGILKLNDWMFVFDVIDEEMSTYTTDGKNDFLYIFNKKIEEFINKSNASGFVIYKN